MIADNLAFRQAATHAADAGTEAAASWLATNNNNSLWQNVAGSGYSAQRSDPSAGQSWDDYWQTFFVPNNMVVTLPTDAAGYTVSYTIQRMCFGVGDPNATGPIPPPPQCEKTTASALATTSSKTAGTVPLNQIAQVYYRITTRVVGPRNTVSYVQTIVAI
jgi:type IV pilus assembly protein PilX